MSTTRVHGHPATTRIRSHPATTKTRLVWQGHLVAPLLHQAYPLVVSMKLLLRRLPSPLQIGHLLQ